jgi:hypothetical protein
MKHVLVFTNVQSRIVRVLNLWQKNGVFPPSVIQPLLNMAGDTSVGDQDLSGEHES